MYATASKTRSATSTCTATRVDAVLDLFLGDVAAFIARGLVSRERATDWLRDLVDVLLLEAVERFQIKVTLPSGAQIGLDYTVSDDGSIAGSDGCGGFSTHWIPANASLTLVIRWRTSAPKYEEARALLRARGWGPATILDASGASDRTFAKDGYGLHRRTIGEWRP